MPYDEETRELNDQFYGRGDYSRDNPDLAVGHGGAGRPLTSDEQATMLMRSVIKLMGEKKTLLAALENLLYAIPKWTAWKQEDEPDECFEARSAIKAAKE